MAPLRNPRHEAFVQALVEGMSATEAYERAGYARDDGNATRLMKNEKVRARLVELQTEIAKDSKITVASLLDELEAARAKATDLDQLSAAVRAIEAKAKVSGLLVQRMEVGGPGDFDKCETIEEVAIELADQFLGNIGNAPFLSISNKDRQGLTDLLNRHMVEVDEYLSAIKARPINAMESQRGQRHQLEHKQKPVNDVRFTPKSGHVRCN